MNVQEFRNNLKKHLDDAVRGIPVSIERGGVRFIIVAAPIGTTDIKHLGGAQKKVPIAAFAGGLDMVDKPLQETVNKSPRADKKPDLGKVEKGYCEHGQVKGECLVKGCRYGHKS